MATAWYVPMFPGVCGNANDSPIAATRRPGAAMPASMLNALRAATSLPLRRSEPPRCSSPPGPGRPAHPRSASRRPPAGPGEESCRRDHQAAIEHSVPSGEASAPERRSPRQLPVLLRSRMPAVSRTRYLSQRLHRRGEAVPLREGQSSARSSLRTMRASRTPDCACEVPWPVERHRAAPAVRRWRPCRSSWQRRSAVAGVPRSRPRSLPTSAPP